VNPRILVGLTEIAIYMRVSPRTVQRWVNQRYFPASKMPTGRWTVSTSLIDTWLHARWQIQNEQREARCRASA